MKKQVKEKSPLKDKQFRKDYSKGNGSPYREWVESNYGNDDNHQQVEPIQANPDTLLEEDGLYFQKECNDELLETVVEVMGTLSPQHRKVIQLCGYEGRTMENCAAILKMSKRKVQLIVEKFRESVLQKHSFRGIQ